MTDEIQAAGEPSIVDGVDAGFADWALMLVESGGPVVALLIGMSVIALAILFLKLWQFQAWRIGDRRTAREALRLYRSGRPVDALVHAGNSPNPAAQAVARAIRGERSGMTEFKVREEVARFAADTVEALRSWLRALEVIASLAPLLGLFGTVLGMIEAFRQMEAAGSRVDPSVLSGGIWEALLTTAVGLAVAIPVVAVLNWLERRVEALAHDIDDVVTQVFTEDLSREFEAEVGRGDPQLRPYGATAGG